MSMYNVRYHCTLEQLRMTFVTSSSFTRLKYILSRSTSILSNQFPYLQLKSYRLISYISEEKLVKNSLPIVNEITTCDEKRKIQLGRMSSNSTYESPVYPPIEPFDSGHLQVSNLHSIYYEQCGNKDGLPIIFVHGGPGGGCSESDRRYFDPKAYHIILFDQRGAGKSTPAFCLEENDTWSLVQDMEKLRTHLGIEQWILFGGSWGSTLSLAYAEKHIDRVLALILRGIFTLREEEIAWFYQKGASFIFPDVWEQYVAPIPEAERDDFVTAYHKRLTGPDEAERLRCAKAWSTWEMATSQLKVNPENLKRAESDTWALAFARIECHYFVNKGFFQGENELIDNAFVIRESGIPVTIVQGRYDVVCPAKTAWDLKKELPKAEFFFVDDAGHSAKEDGITRRLVEACDKYKKIVKKK